jgi:hypothetical protein
MKVNHEWIGFGDLIEFMMAPTLPSGAMRTIYHTRESYIENVRSWVFLVPRRVAHSEMEDLSVSPLLRRQHNRRLVKHRGNGFLSKTLSRFASLTFQSNEQCIDLHGKPAAQYFHSAQPIETETLITLRGDILSAYCEQHSLVPFWITDSFRWSERSIDEFNLPIERVERADGCYRYAQHADTNNFKRPRMRTRSWIRGKRLLIMK